MAEERMVYDKTETMGPVASKADAPDVADYPSLTAEGRVEIEIALPAPRGPIFTESVQVRDLPAHITQRVEADLARGDEASEVFAHYGGAIEGAGVVSGGTAEKLHKLVTAFAQAGEPEKYFKEVVKPFLFGLKPGKKG